MQWWDSSAIIALVLVQQMSSSLEKQLVADAELAVWWGTKVEGVSGIYRAYRSGSLRAHAVTDMITYMERMLSTAFIVPPSEAVQSGACDMLRLYSLRAADALQLSAAIEWTDRKPHGAGFVCLDRRLREAAEREGFRLLPEFD